MNLFMTSRRTALTCISDDSEEHSAAKYSLFEKSQLQTRISFYSVYFLYEVQIYFAKYCPFCLKVKIYIWTGPLAWARAKFCDFMHTERSNMARPAWAKRLKKDHINHKAVGEWKTEIERRCSGKRGKRIGSCGLRLRLCTWTDAVCWADWIWLAE